MHKLITTLTAAAILGGCAVAGGSVTKEDRQIIYATSRPVPVTAPEPVSANPVAAVVAPAQPEAERQVVVYFDFDKFDVKPMYLKDLERVAGLLKNGPARAMVEGHTDAQGSTEYNLGLGQRRAEAVRKVLETYGAPASGLEAISYGKERLAVEGRDEASHAKNRRAEILLVRP
ncbi:OmpA family protein [Aquabacterium sp. A08]|uniref:OmpA family protein n=1 Tax=Aquabacterium sp. A08 TaxID=2718532 RepID=UPI00141F827E|nr:OmpA family protein [Aquabacterium sp. A08]NIC43626.1 OmpA family protein [Aquabacterium sp. A08]